MSEKVVKGVPLVIGHEYEFGLDPKQLSKIRVSRAPGEVIADTKNLTIEEQLDCVKRNILNELKEFPVPPGTPIDLVELTDRCRPLGWDPQLVIDALVELYREAGLLGG
jgi:hypothetical protein